MFDFSLFIYLVLLLLIMGDFKIQSDLDAYPGSMYDIT